MASFGQLLPQLPCTSAIGAQLDQVYETLDYGPVANEDKGFRGVASQCNLLWERKHLILNC